MNKFITLIPNLVIIVFFLSNISCEPGEKGKGNLPENHSLKILATDAIVSEKDEDGKNRVSEDLRKLCEVLVSEQEDCNKTIVPEPTLIRIDTEEELSLKTALKSFSGDVTKVKVIQKLITKNFKNEIEIPKSFLKSKVDSIDAFSKLNAYILTKTVKDSLLFYSQEAASKYYTFNNLKYKFYDDIDDVRKKMLEILCKNDKASFVLVINPPKSEPLVVIVKPDTTKPAVTVVKKVVKKKGKKGDIIIEKKREDRGFLGKDRTVDDMKSGIYTKKELNGNNQ